MLYYQIPIFDRVIRKALGVKVWSLPQREVLALYRAIVLYGLRLCSAKESSRILRFLHPGDRIRLREVITADVNLILSMKGFIHYLIQNRIYKRLDVIDAFKKFELPICADLLNFLQDSKLLDKYSCKIAAKPPALTPKQVEKICVQELKKLDKFTKNYAYSKMRFLTTSNNIDLEDIVMMLKYGTCHTCYNNIGEKRDLYLTNNLKSNISSAGINIIKHYTSNKRQRLIKVQVGDDENKTEYFENLIRSSSITNDQGEDDGDLLERVVSDNDPREHAERKASLYLQTKSIIRQYGENSPEHRLAEILDNNCKDFVDWYNKSCNTKFTEVIEIQDDRGSGFLKVLQDYFNIRGDNFKSFLKTIAPRFVEVPEHEIQENQDVECK